GGTHLGAISGVGPRRTGSPTCLLSRRPISGTWSHWHSTASWAGFLDLCRLCRSHLLGPYAAKSMVSRHPARYPRLRADLTGSRGVDCAALVSASWLVRRPSADPG